MAGRDRHRPSTALAVASHPAVVNPARWNRRLRVSPIGGGAVLVGETVVRQAILFRFLRLMVDLGTAARVSDSSVLPLLAWSAGPHRAQVMAKKRKKSVAKSIGKRKSVSKKAQPARKAAVARRRVARKTSRKKAASRIVVLRG